MKVLITGIAGFAGSTIAHELLDEHSGFVVMGMDNFSRKGCEVNVSGLRNKEIGLIRGDIRARSDVEDLPHVDWVIDCAANPSVLAGLQGQSSSRQVMEHNLMGTINLLEYCKKHKAGFILLSTSRVYSAKNLANLAVNTCGDSFELEESRTKGISKQGITERFPTNAPISLYGASKLASETLLMEYAESFGFPAWINRCGVLGGAGQFGKADQGILSYWIHSFCEKKPLKYIGFNGSGLQVRDALHPKDLVPLLVLQMQNPERDAPKVINLGGGLQNSISLKQLSTWCENRFGPNEIVSSTEQRPMDAPWIVMDSSLAQDAWNWKPQTQLENILNQIAVHAENNPNWLSITN